VASISDNLAGATAEGAGMDEDETPPDTIRTPITEEITIIPTGEEDDDEVVTFH
jgi:hypothetical protein